MGRCAFQFEAGADGRALDHPKASGREMNSVPFAVEDEATARSRAAGVAAPVTGR